MIKLEVEKYCENCPEFEADVGKTSYISSSIFIAYIFFLLFLLFLERKHRYSNIKTQ